MKILSIRAIKVKHLVGLQLQLSCSRSLNSFYQVSWNFPEKSSSIGYARGMAIPGKDYWLIDTETGRVFGADTTVVVPEVLGALAYDIYYDEEAAIEYGEQQGLVLDLPEGDGIPVTQLTDEERGYIAIDLDNGNTADAANLKLTARNDEDFPDPDDAVELANVGSVPLVPVEVLELEGLPFETIADE